MSPILRVVSLAALVFGGMGTLHAADPFSGFEDCPVVADSDLDQMRGGFETSSGGLPLSFTFGIERQTYLNGQLVSTTTIAIPTFPFALNAQGAAAVQFNPINVIQNGAGNVFALQGVKNLPASVMTVIQNSLDNQVIGNATVINASITSRDFLRSLAAQSSLNHMVFRSVH